ncbi:hypothetical protein CHLRE_12g527350v5 [Chlamydomonas reinhardtii]|uniref:Uncharacterized protein n=1 Tax=Chlamydomonas reinhardtii TaxID=3055 RepID=A0A2K3D4J9_CHLRE|nr:uncharacterized protein CHLRE_12g527350v5 [Chlamydomonas reinhardtii]PNW75460.1 hypothetical protein CHLRE_12g527350v5 [Chlamydomonas reinhardtii]
MCRVPATELLQRLVAGKRLLGISVTPLSVEVAAVGPPYVSGALIRTGRFLSPEELKVALLESQADAVLLGGSGAFRTDGTTQLGVRKLVSQLRGLVYHSDWLPSPALVGAAAGAATALATAPVTAAAAVASAGGATPTTAVSVANGSSGLGSGDQIGAAVCVPVWYCRRGEDDPVAMLVEYVQAHTTPQQRLAIRAMVGAGANSAPAGGRGGGHLGGSHSGGGRGSDGTPAAG